MQQHLPEPTRRFWGEARGQVDGVIKELFRGALAGAAGTTALNAATYLDMAARARPSSSTPQQVVEELSRRYGRPIPGSGEERENRLEGLGPLGGVATGVAVGTVFGWLRSLGLRPGPVVGPLLIGASAMVGTDASMAALGITDPREWDAASWLSDVIPHLVFGYVTHASLVAMEDE